MFHSHFHHGADGLFAILIAGAVLVAVLRDRSPRGAGRRSTAL